MKILLEAPVLTKSGYGEHSRFVFRALSSTIKDPSQAEIYVNPLNWGTTSWISEETEEKSKIDDCILRFGNFMNFCREQKQNPGWDVQIHVGIPNEFEKKAPYSICVTAGIETDRVDASWLFKTHKGIQKIIVPSEHAKRGFTETNYEIFNQENNQKTLLNCASNVQVVPYPHKEHTPVDLDFQLETKFNFLSIALLSPRKNIESMLKWFVEEFKDEDVGLVLKTAYARGSILDRKRTTETIEKILKNYPDRKCKIYLLHGSMTEEEIHSLYMREDIHAYVTTTHGEGFGLPIFEAAYSGLPIVATDWSAHLDFLSAPYKEGKSKNPKTKKLFAKVGYDLGEIPEHVVWKDIIPAGSQWAYPKQESFKRQIRNVYKNHGMYKKWSIELKKEIEKTHCPEKIMSEMIEAMISDMHPAVQSRFRPDQNLNKKVVVFE
tara:strand:- start:1318 stop:2622 length:1305 start_codon:yes stop_codon:yes gene_type:complete